MGISVDVTHNVIPDGDRWDIELGSIPLSYGAGRAMELPEVIRKSGGRRVLLVTDAGLASAGHPQRVEALLVDNGIECVVFDDVAQNPCDGPLCRAASDLEGADVDLIVALGGGSVIDAAKGLNFLLTNGGRVEDYWGYGKVTTPLLPAVAVPTTGGTGSDAQTYAVISQDGTRRKMACGDPSARFRAVLLDPELALTAPSLTVAATGMDAISHALESHVTTVRTEASSRLSREAWLRLDGNIEACFDDAADQLVCRGNMLAAAHLAGAAIEASMLGAAHAAANPLTARYGITHGIAIALLLPSVIRFNGDVADEHYRELDPGGAEVLARRIETLRETIGLPVRLADCEVDRGSLEELALQATREWTATHNPRPVNETGFLEIYEAVY